MKKIIFLILLTALAYTGMGQSYEFVYNTFTNQLDMVRAAVNDTVWFADGTYMVTAAASDTTIFDVVGSTATTKTAIDNMVFTGDTVGIDIHKYTPYTYSGGIVSMTAGENLTAYEMTYCGSDGKMWKADADTVTTMYGVMIALEAITADAAGYFAMPNTFISNTSWNWTLLGQPVYVSTTSGELTQTAPSAYGNVVQIVGIATHADRIFFYPELVQVEIGEDSDSFTLTLETDTTHSDANWYPLYLDGGSVLIEASTVWTFDILITGTNADQSKTFAFKILGHVKHDGAGNTTLMSESLTTSYDTDDVSFDARVTADDVNDALLVEVSDSDGTGDKISWGASVRVIKKTF